MRTDRLDSIPFDNSRLCLSKVAPLNVVPALCLIVGISGVENEDCSFGIMG